jgi:hypothetical protein
VKNVRFVNILARGESGVHISAAEPGLIDGVLLENVRVEVDKWGDIEGGYIDRRPYSGEPKVFKHAISAFHIDNASNVVLRNCEAAWGSNKQEYFAHAIEASDVDGLTVEGFVGEAAFPHQSDLELQRSRLVAADSVIRA